MEIILKTQGVNITTSFFLRHIQYWPLSQAIDTTKEWMDHWSVLLCQFLIV